MSRSGVSASGVSGGPSDERSESEGDPESEPATFLASRFVAGLLAVVLLGTGVLGDPLWLSLAFGGAVGGAFAGTSYLLHLIFD